MKTPAILLTALLATLAPVGCSAGPLPGSVAAPGANTSAGPSPAATKPAASRSGSGSGSGKHVDVCSVVSLAKVNSVTGRTYGTDVVFADDDIHPGDEAEIPESAYVQLITTLQSAR
jgi:hypothetical protein